MRARNARGRNRGPGLHDTAAGSECPMPPLGPGAGAGDVPGTSGLDVGLDVVDRLLHRSDLLGFLVGDLALEFFFERHHQFDGVERVGTEVVDEGSAVADLFFLDAQLFDDDFLDAFFDAAHWLLRSEEHTSELQSLMPISYAVFCLKKKRTTLINP